MSSIPTGGNFIFCCNLLKPLDANFVHNVKFVLDYLQKPWMEYQCSRNSFYPILVTSLYCSVAYSQDNNDIKNSQCTVLTYRQYTVKDILGTFLCCRSVPTKTRYRPLSISVQLNFHIRYSRVLTARLFLSHTDFKTKKCSRNPGIYRENYVSSW